MWSWERKASILDNNLALSCIAEHSYTCTPGISHCLPRAEPLWCACALKLCWDIYWTLLQLGMYGQGLALLEPQICCPQSWAFAPLCHTNSTKKVGKQFPEETLAGMHQDTHTHSSGVLNESKNMGGCGLVKLILLWKPTGIKKSEKVLACHFLTSVVKWWLFQGKWERLR